MNGEAIEGDLTNGRSRFDPNRELRISARCYGHLLSSRKYYSYYSYYSYMPVLERGSCACCGQSPGLACPPSPLLFFHLQLDHLYLSTPHEAALPWVPLSSAMDSDHPTFP